jgi:integrase
MPDQAEATIREGRHIAPLIRFLFCSGCRLGEALSLDWTDVDLTVARAILWEHARSSRRNADDLAKAIRRTLGVTGAALTLPSLIIP